MQKLKKELANRDISIYEMSKKTGIPYSTLNDIVNEKIGINRIKLENAVKIAEYLHITIEELYIYNHIQEITFIDEFCGIHTGMLFAQDGIFYLKYQNGNKEETCDICPVNKFNIPFIDDFAEWTLKKIVNLDLLERWDELM